MGDFLASIFQHLTADALGSEILALVDHHSLTVAEFAIDIVGLIATAVLLDYATRWARASLMAMLFLGTEAMILLGLPVAVWIRDGADLHREIYEVLLSSWDLLVSPWPFIAVLSPLFFLAIPMRYQFLDLGGTAIPLHEKLLIFTFLGGIFFSLGVTPNSGAWPVHLLLIAVLLEAMLPTLALLILYAMSRRLKDHTTSRPALIRSVGGGRSIWQRPEEMTQRDLDQIQLSFHRWRAGSPLASVDKTRRR